MDDNENCYLGLDIGSTTTKVTVLTAKDASILHTSCKAHNAESQDTASCEAKHEQCPYRIYESIEECVSLISTQLKSKVRAISVSGQMHGCVLWNAFDIHQFPASPIIKSCTTNLISWQDQRCDATFLQKLPSPDSHLNVFSGYGCASIFWMIKSRLNFNFEFCGMIQDFIVHYLCGFPSINYMSPQNAASWGFFDTVSSTWNKDILAKHGFPVNILPKIASSGTIVGEMRICWNGFSKGTKIYVANGDLACSMLPILIKDPETSIINIGTSAQLVNLMPQTFEIDKDSLTKYRNELKEVEYVPFINDLYLAEIASLNGGNVLEHFVNSFHLWMNELNTSNSVSKSEIWKNLVSMPSDHQQILKIIEKKDFIIQTNIFGERLSPSTFGSILNIKNRHVSAKEIFVKLCYGIVQNLKDISFKTNQKYMRLIGTGSAMKRNPILQFLTSHTFNLPFELCEIDADASYGSALYAYYLNQNDSKLDFEKVKF